MNKLKHETNGEQKKLKVGENCHETIPVDNYVTFY